MVHQKDQDCLIELFSLLCAQKGPVQNRTKKIKEGKMTPFSNFYFGNFRIYDLTRTYLLLWMFLSSYFEFIVRISGHDA